VRTGHTTDSTSARSGRDPLRRIGRAFLIASIVLLVAAAAGGLWGRARLRASLPQLDGERRIPGLSAPVVIARDGLGIPTIRAANRVDVARASGFLHGQDRFFQMDLARRRAAGELAALVGGRAIALDREIRVHRFRAEAQRAIALTTPHDRTVLEAYTAGVNSGLSSLAAKPFEYFLLRQDPLPWRPEDSLLTVLSMFITLQDTDGSYEATLATMSDMLPREMVEFLAPQGTEWDAPVVGAAFGMPPVPGPEIDNPRARRDGRRPLSPRRRPEIARLGNVFETMSASEYEAVAVGSNNWAVAARLTPNGAALVANDMHLSIRVPNIWYRAAFEWSDPASPGARHQLFGVTLPGVPAMVVGSNTHIAWGFTNTYGDWSDIVLLETDAQRPGMYLTPDGWQRFEQHDEVIDVAGQPSQHQQVQWTIWGPVIGADHRGRLRAYRWVAHSADRLVASLVPLESARTVEEALAAGNGLGTPAQNLVVADREGHIGWSIYGAIPRRVGFDGQLPASWADGTRGWRGWLDAADYPRVIDPPQGRIWTANARVVDGAMLEKIGDGSYEIGSRARIIRDRLMSKESFTPTDLYDIQLETRAEFLERWRELILRTLTREATTGRPQRELFRRVVERGWSGHASPDSAAYRLTRVFREQVSEWVFTFVLADCYEADESFDYTTVRKREGPLWRIVSERPPHLLDPQYRSWEAMLLAAIDRVIDETMRNRTGDLSDRRWSEFNVVAYRHPLSAAIPLLGRWLDMPHDELPGDLYTPRMAWGSVAASERMVVSPGKESEGIMQMPTGQSGHPLSPFYANSHQAWVKGTPTPFLPGAAEHTLRLTP
jgi:penicillin amidase